MVHLFWKILWQLFRRLYIHLLPSPRQPSPRHSRNENICLNKAQMQMFIVDLPIIVKSGNKSCYLTGKWINKPWCNQTMEQHLAIERTQWWNPQPLGDCTVLSERIQTQKTTYSMTFWKRENYRDRRKIGGLQDLQSGASRWKRDMTKVSCLIRNALYLDFCGGDMAKCFFKNCTQIRVNFTVYKVQ